MQSAATGCTTVTRSPQACALAWPFENREDPTNQGVFTVMRRACSRISPAGLPDGLVCRFQARLGCLGGGLAVVWPPLTLQVVPASAQRGADSRRHKPSRIAD